MAAPTPNHDRAAGAPLAPASQSLSAPAGGVSPDGRLTDQAGLIQPIKSLAIGARSASRAGEGRRQERRPGATGARRRLGGGSALGLRWGELIGFHRRDLDLEHRTVRVRRAVAELSNGRSRRRRVPRARGRSPSPA